MKWGYILGGFTAIMIGVMNGLFPAWLGITVFFMVTALMTHELIGMMRGSGIDSDVANATTGITTEKIITTWTQSLRDREMRKVPIKQSWNCKNCGGPNIDRIQCQYCGQVKE